MSRLAHRELLAAGITDPLLQTGYLRARALNAEHGKTYYLATLLLPRAKRPYVHALYGFARWADDVVDEPAGPSADRRQRFDQLSETFAADLARQHSADPVCDALLDTRRRWGLPGSYFTDFLQSMRMDLTVTEYPTYADLEQYMWGSAAVIGLQMLPILGRASADVAWDRLRQPAIDLGLAFQLTNFIRDIGEDLDRGRIYLPQNSLRAAGVDRDRLQRARRSGQIDGPIRTLIAAEVARAQGLYESARAGVPLVHPTSQDCLWTALTLYGEILDQIRRAEYNVFARRATVSQRRRIQVGSAGLARAMSTRLS